MYLHVHTNFKNIFTATTFLIILKMRIFETKVLHIQNEILYNIIKHEAFASHARYTRYIILIGFYANNESRACVTQFWPPDNEHMWSNHVEERKIPIVKQKFCTPSCLITENCLLICSSFSKSSKPAYYFITLWEYRT